MIEETEHINSIKYKEFIVNHPNYKDLACKTNPKNGKITWMRTRTSCPERVEWWNKQKKKLNVAKWSEAALHLLPKELDFKKPCQLCGEYLDMRYIYPNANFFKRINKFFKTNYEPFNNREKAVYPNTIFEIIDKHSDNVNFFINEFQIPTDYTRSINLIKKFILDKYSYTQNSKLSPGAKANPPDRLDGFHSYNNCCREMKDKGRSKENMSSYVRDRRAYENWADGNFVLANDIMGKFRSYNDYFKCPVCSLEKKPSADHIGPISLGFSHRPEFYAVCSDCNSSKNNRMTLKDIKMLLRDEEKGITVISWHSKYLWDMLKNLIASDEQALIASKLMRNNIHHILTIFSEIYLLDDGKTFLSQFLHPEYTDYKYDIYNFDPLKVNNIILVDKVVNIKKYANDNTTNIVIHQKTSTARTKQKSKDEYIRISFEELQNYRDKENRRVELKYLQNCEKELNILYSLIEQSNFQVALEKLKNVLDFIASQFEIDFKNSSTDI
ncbi:hypothetical protein L5F09_10105 [Aliarcobacter butzleri]|uniref:hypothetical protein n=1 Tax=Aliarcobacter butzleri TaxID=28197 RepID=UPI001ED9F106|nr:hypothetical protein [Aliarcobacter butzleri]MCG3666107.1 hypothetical protein [Aliarcobacter butzleri]